MIVLYKKADFHCSFKKTPVKISVSKRTTIWSFIYQHHYKPPIKKNLFNAYSSTFSILWGNTNKKMFTINYDYLHLYTFRRNQKKSEQNQPSYTHLRFKAHNSTQRIKAKAWGNDPMVASCGALKGVILDAFGSLSGYHAAFLWWFSGIFGGGGVVICTGLRFTAAVLFKL